MGRHPKSAVEKKATGNPGNRKPRMAPKATPAGKKPPLWLTDRSAKAIWKKLHAELSAVSILQNRDEYALARYCRYLAEWVKADRKLKESVYLTDSAHGKMLRIHPLFNVRKMLHADLFQLEIPFGLTPLSRHNLVAQQAAQIQHSLPLDETLPAPAPVVDEDIAGPIPQRMN